MWCIISSRSYQDCAEELVAPSDHSLIECPRFVATIDRKFLKAIKT